MLRAIRQRCLSHPILPLSLLVLGLAAVALVRDALNRRQLGGAGGVPVTTHAAAAHSAGHSSDHPVGESVARVIFAMDDPDGDDYGPGGYLYPKHSAFAPHKGLFDLLRFRVLDAPQSVLFEFMFAAMSNPWGAPEGFFHQRMDVYIDAVPAKGETEPVRPGPGVHFAPEYGWEYRLRIAPFHGSRWFTNLEAGGPDGLAKGVIAQVQPDGKTVRVSVSKKLVPAPEPTWKYYVLVGAHDAFGPDGYRAVDSEGGDWVFGGARVEVAAAPRVIDLLAPGWGRNTQEKMLSAELGPGGGVVVYPVGGGWDPQLPLGLVAVGVLVAVGGFLLLLIRVRARKSI